MITVDALNSKISKRIEHYNLIDNELTTRETLRIPLTHSNHHILAQSIKSPFDVPRQNLSAMDGYAIAEGSHIDKGCDITIVGESQAGSPFYGQLLPGQGVRIFTGAVVPSACNTVVMQENTNFADIKEVIDKSQPYTITLTKAATTAQNIRRQGEEITKSETVLKIGKRLNPTDISLLANLGVAQVNVYAPLTVGLLATGDELVNIGEPLSSLAQIYNSNTPTLKALLTNLPITLNDYGIIPDHLETTRDTVKQAMSECDVLISTAGVSVGDYDFLTTVIEELGQINHYKVAMKPGKPFVFGELTKDLHTPVLYFGLPGNPLSTVVGVLQFIIPALWRLSGIKDKHIPMPLTVFATLKGDIRKSVGRTDFQRGVLTQDKTGVYSVTAFAKQQSHRIKQLSQANCLIKLAQNSGNVASGTQVEVQPLPWI